MSQKSYNDIIQKFVSEDFYNLYDYRNLKFKQDEEDLTKYSLLFNGATIASTYICQDKFHRIYTIHELPCNWNPSKREKVAGEYNKCVISSKEIIQYPAAYEGTHSLIYMNEVMVQYEFVGKACGDVSRIRLKGVYLSDSTVDLSHIRINTLRSYHDVVLADRSQCDFYNQAIRQIEQNSNSVNQNNTSNLVPSCFDEELEDF